jgi:hypothetical protein
VVWGGVALADVRGASSEADAVLRGWGLPV